MNHRFVIEDDLHAEVCSEHITINEAVEELKRLASIPWGQAPNVAPCIDEATCRRTYAIIEYDCASEPWTELRKVHAFEISVEGISWNKDWNHDLA